MTASGTKKENKWTHIKQSGFKFQDEAKGQSDSWIILLNFYAIFNYFILSNIDNLLIGKLMTYIFNIIICLCHASISSFFSLSVLLKLLKHVKLIVKYNTKIVTRFNKNVATCHKKSTDDPREESITDNPEKDPITED